MLNTSYSDLQRSMLRHILLRLIPFESHPTPRGQKIYIQRKCGADFVYLIEGCGKTLNIDKRHNTPHSNRYGISGHEECALP